MGKMEQTFKIEVARLAKKEVRAACLPLARDVRRLKRLVASLRRTVGPLAKVGAEWQAARASERTKLAVAPEEVQGSRLSPRLIKKIRARLGITQGELATLVHVSGSAVGSWEYGKAKPEGRNREALIALRKLGRRDVAAMLKAQREAAPAAETKKPRGRRKKA